MDYLNMISPLAKENAFPANENERRELGLKLWSGEVLNAYHEALVTGGTTRKVALGNGREVQFPATTKVKGGFASPGMQIAQDTTFQTEITITCDDIMYASLFFPLQYDLVGHLNFRQQYAKEAGITLAKAEDIMNFCNIRKAANTLSIFDGVDPNSGHYGGDVLASDLFINDGGAVGAADDNEVAMAIFNSLFRAAEIMQEKNLPMGAPKFCVMRPREYFILIRAIQSGGFALSNKDYMAQPANLNQALLPPIAGFNITVSNLLPTTDLTGTGASADVNPNTLVDIPLHTRHETDFSQTVGLIWTPDAVGTVVQQGIATKMEHQLNQLGDLLVSYMLVGGGVIRPDSAIELRTATLPYI